MIHGLNKTVLGILALLASGCADRGIPPKVSSTSGPEPIHPLLAYGISEVDGGERVQGRVVIVTIDGVRWQEIFQGSDPARTNEPPLDARSMTPNLHRLGERQGAFIGAPDHGTISATGPNYVSLPGYNEILGGRAPRCQDNKCTRTPLPSLLDEARAAGAKVAAFSSWETIALAASSAPGGFKLSCGRNHDDAIDPWPGEGDYRPDHLTIDLALAYYEKERPDVFFLGLGDTDEHAHHGNYPQYVQALRRADDVVGRLVNLIDENTTIVVTADHGRAESFNHHGGMVEAGRVWLAAAGPHFHARGEVISAHPRRLADITPTLRVVLGLPPDTSERSGAPIEELFEAPKFEFTNRLAKF
jgi:hypothetical protein